jgi:UDP:flavonoid glycosyltransferase YjiC (YdhE family)
MLLAGKPLLQLPSFLEQTLTSIAVDRLGAGMGASVRDSTQISRRLTALLHDDKWAEAARRFAARYAKFSPEEEIADMLDRAESCLK